MVVLGGHHRFQVTPFLIAGRLNCSAVDPTAVSKVNPNRKIFEARKRETAALGAGEKLVLGHPLAATIGDSARCMQNLEKVLFTGPKTSDTVTFTHEHSICIIKPVPFANDQRAFTWHLQLQANMSIWCEISVVAVRWDPVLCQNSALLK